MTRHRDQGCFNFVSLESTWAWHKVTPQIILVSLPQSCSRPPLYTDSFICFMIIGSVIKNSPGNAGDVGEVNLIPGSGKLPGEGNGNPLQYSYLGNPMDRGAWQATVMGSQRVGHDWVTNSNSRITRTSVQFSSVTHLCLTLQLHAARQASLSATNSPSLLRLMSIELVMPSNHLILCHPLLLMASIFPSIRVFSNEPVLHIRWSKYWSFSFSINLSNEYSELISLRIDWFDLFAVQGTLKSLLQYHSSKAFQRSVFFIVQLSHPYMTTGKTIALTRRTFVSKVTSLLFNILSRLVIDYLPRSKHLLTS